MRLLDRAAVTPPACLQNYRHGRDPWSALATNHDDYAEVCRRLDEMQGPRCAYCESDLLRESGRPHVEHFVQRGRRPELTFEWSNLFRSCSHPEHCGKFKDSGAGAYAPQDLLKPDTDDGRVFLRFYSDGAVRPREGLDGASLRRASETIRVLALDCGRLRGMRRSHLDVIVQELDRVAEVAGELSEEELTEELERIEAAYRDVPYRSAIKDLLGTAV